MRWSKGQGYLRIVERHEFGSDPEQKRMLKLTRLASGLGDVQVHLMRHNPTLLDERLPLRPDDARTIKQLIADHVDALGTTCEGYLNREIELEAFKEQVRAHTHTCKQLAMEIRSADLGD